MIGALFFSDEYTALLMQAFLSRGVWGFGKGGVLEGLGVCIVELAQLYLEKESWSPVVS